MTANNTGFGELPFTQDQRSLIDFVARQIMNGLATTTIVKVVAVTATTVDVQPLVKQIDGAGTGISHGTVHALPWFSMRAGVCEVSLKPRVGDIGLATFCHSDITNVKATKAEAVPASRRRFDWADGIYFGGILAASAATTSISVDDLNNVTIASPTLNLTTTAKVAVTGPVDSDTEYRVGGKKVVGAQQGAITAPTGGSTIDTQARTAISAILTAMQAHGLIA